MEHGAWGIEQRVRSQRSKVESQTTDDRGQTTASKIVNLSYSQMVMNGLNDELTN